jgi:hypothetical protein
VPPAWENGAREAAILPGPEWPVFVRIEPSPEIDETWPPPSPSPAPPLISNAAFGGTNVVRLMATEYAFGMLDTLPPVSPSIW